MTPIGAQQAEGGGGVRKQSMTLAIALSHDHPYIKRGQSSGAALQLSEMGGPPGGWVAPHRPEAWHTICVFSGILCSGQVCAARPLLLSRKWRQCSQPPSARQGMR
jgi:hypothetical protein